MAESLRARVYHVLEGDSVKTDKAHPIVYLLVVLIAANVAAVILDSVESLHAEYGGWFDAFEWFSLTIFTAEYVARVWACTVDPNFARPVVGRLKYMATPLTLVDLASIVPSIIALFTLGGVDLRALRVLRFFRLLRILKLGRYSASAQALGAVFKERRADLAVAMGAVLILLVLSASVVYIAEHDAQPERFSSIPESMWWAIITLTTIGYGDVYPITPLGKLFGALTALLGVGIVALPAGILAAGFHDQLQRRRRAQAQPCPHCGKDVNAPAEAVRVPVQEPAAPAAQPEA